jgi:hypothetical protein
VSSFTFPTIKKVFPKLLVDEIVSVQALSAPTGNLHHIEYVKSSRYQSYLTIRDGVKYYDRDEFYAYDEILQGYLKENYPDEYKRTS